MLLINASQRLSNTTKETIIQKFDARMRKFVQPYQWIGLLVEARAKSRRPNPILKRKQMRAVYSLKIDHAIQGEIHQFLHNEGDFRDVLCGSDSNESK